MLKRPIAKIFLYRFVEGFVITIVAFTFSDLFWYGFDVFGAVMDGSDLSTVKVKLTLNLARALTLPFLYSFVMTLLESLNVRTKISFFEWLEGRHFRRQK